MAQVWCQVLLLPSVHASERFTDLGGESLLALRACAALRYELEGKQEEDEAPSVAAARGFQHTSGHEKARKSR